MRYLASLSLVAALASRSTAEPRTALDTFGSKLHGQLAAGSTGNLVYSPASLLLALAMTREGAAGRTAAEMDAVLGPAARDQAVALGRALPRPVKDPGAPVLTIANRLYGERSLPFVPGFLDATRTRYGATLEPVDFVKNFEGARKTINRWVAQQTHDRIKDLLAPRTLDADTRLVLVNAIYLKAQWQRPFLKSATAPAPFAIAGSATRDVATMRAVLRIPHGSHGGARMVDLPYVAAPGGPQLSMLVVVPDAANLAAVEAEVTRTGIQPFLAKTTTRGDVALALPKFKIGSDFSLGEALEKLGMPRAFSDDAEFGAMTRAEELKISKVIHKAWIEVDESGTEAAAATAVVMTMTTSVPRQPLDFKVDRSFLFFLHDQAGNVLFAGRVIDPAS